MKPPVVGAWMVTGTCWLMLGLGLLFWFLAGMNPMPASGFQSGRGGVTVMLLYTLTWVEVSVVGALIAGRQPGNPIGWLIMLATVLATLQSLFGGYAHVAALDIERPDGFSIVTAWLGSWIGASVLGVIVVTLLVFPTGRLLFPWIGLVAWLGVLSSLAQAAGFAFQTGGLRALPTLQNPVAIESGAGVAALTRDLGTAGIVLSMVAAAGLLLLRLVRASGKERQQLKWIAYASGLFAFGVGALSFAPAEWNELAPAVFAVTGAALTTAVGVAMLRYQLFDIDLLINRTLVYGCLMVTLLAAYAAAVVLLELLLSPFTRGSDIAIAVSTLGVAALFRPALRWIRDAIDRRFYRQKYDAVRTLEAFGINLRKDVDLDSVTAELINVVYQTMQPTRISLWLRQPHASANTAGDGDANAKKRSAWLGVPSSEEHS